MEQIKPNVKWLSQRDNLNAFTGDLEAHNQCMIASFTMMMQWVREYLLTNNLPSFEFYTEFTHYIIVGENKDKAQKVRFNSINHASKLNAMLSGKKIPFKFVSKNLDFIGMKKIIEGVDNSGFPSPVLIGTMETSAGHIVVNDGKIQNPYGRPENRIHSGNCKYININGANLEYSDEFFINMVFREMQNGKTSKTNVKRLCWYITKI